MAFEIDWLSGSSAGYRDIIPAHWFNEDGATGDREHIVIGPDGSAAIAHCALHVEGSTALLSYDGEHSSRNRADFHLGSMKLEFRNSQRIHLAALSWRPSDKTDFEPCDVSWIDPSEKREPGFWWVNHKQTFKHEIGQGFLWSPKRSRDAQNPAGRRNQFYENMRDTRRGDLVFSYSNGQISYIGLVTTEAVTAIMPPEFEPHDHNWNRDGWCVGVSWWKAPKPLRPIEIFEDIQPHLPERYSPLNRKDGKGLQSVYLAAVPQKLSDVLLNEFGVFGDAVRRRSIEESDVSSILRRAEEYAEQAILNNTDISETVREEVRKARIGQGRFRRNLGNIETKCRISLVSDPRLLVASHIKPWAVCENNHERLDGNNGLLLAPHFDRLFDRGWISFEDDGTLMVSDHLDMQELKLLGLNCEGEISFGSFNSEQARYLKYHRENRFKK